MSWSVIICMGGREYVQLIDVQSNGGKLDAKSLVVSAENKTFGE